MPTFAPPKVSKQMVQNKPAPARTIASHVQAPVFPPPPPAGPRRVTGCYTADEVRALPGELVSIEGTQPPGRYWCTWLEDVE